MGDNNKNWDRLVQAVIVDVFVILASTAVLDLIDLLTAAAQHYLC